MELTRILEAILFVSENPVTVDEIVDLLRQNPAWGFPAEAAPVEEAFQALVEKYAGSEHVFEVRSIARGYQLLTKKEVEPYVKPLILARDNKRLSRAALETLAIVAYRQPVAKSDVEYIRGVNSDYAVQKLLDKQLIEPAGRSDAPGKPLLYRTTHFFMEYFGIKDLSELPKLQELKYEEENPIQLFQNPVQEENSGQPASDSNVEPQQ